MNNTIKISVIKYLEANHGTNWCWSGIISRAVHEETGHKESVIERHGLRKLREEGILEVDYAQVDGSGPKCSRYRVKPLDPHKIGEHGAVCMVGRSGDLCCECNEPVKPLEEKQALDNIFNQWIDMKKRECH